MDHQELEDEVNYVLPHWRGVVMTVVCSALVSWFVFRPENLFEEPFFWLGLPMGALMHLGNRAIYKAVKRDQTTIWVLVAIGILALVPVFGTLGQFLGESS